MKRVLSLLLLAAAVSLPLPVFAEKDSAEEEKKSEIPAQGSDWAAGPSDMWEVNYNTALAKAAQEHKKVYVVCAGSDWCGWCIKLRKEVLSSEEFEKFAEANLILLYLDFPKEKKLPDAQQQHNAIVSEKLKMNDGFPVAAVLDEKGRVIARQDGFADLDAYMEFLKKAVKK